MNTTELFLQAVNAYKAWINTGMDFSDFTEFTYEHGNVRNELAGA